MNLQGVAAGVVESLGHEVVQTIRFSPAAGAAQLGLTVAQLGDVPLRGSGGWCDGASFVDDGRIMYRPTLGRRENFTICHEIAHHALRDDDAAIDWVYDQGNPEDALEDLCDRVAALLLVSDSVVDKALVEHGVTASAVVAIYDKTIASRHCCANRVIDHVQGKGFITIVDAERMTVWGTAKKPATSPVSYQQQPVPPNHPLHRLRSNDDPVRVKAWWPLGPNDRWPYYLDALRHGRWIIAVFAENDLWDVERLHLAPAEREAYDGDVRCPCGYSGETRWYPCNECNTPLCPRCRKCRCDYRAERELWERCLGCTVSVRSHLLEDGYCDTCR
jgi:hypothetical protein